MKKKNPSCKKSNSDSENTDDDDKYKKMFDLAPVSLWKEDFTLVRKKIDELKAEGIEDFRKHFKDNPDVVNQLLKQVQVLDVNKKTIELLKAKKKSDIIGSFNTIDSPDRTKMFIEEITAMASGKTSFEAETKVRDKKGNYIDVMVGIRFPKNKDDYKHVLVSITEITLRKKAEEELKKRYHELEQFEKFAVDRELKMIELKKKIKKLAKEKKNAHK